MKEESTSEKIDGIDVTNVPEEYQEEFLSHVHDAKRAGRVASTVEKLVAINPETFKEFYGVDGAEKLAQDPETGRPAREAEKDSLADARTFVADDENVNIEAAHAEMERALKKDIQEKLS